ncbi:MAG TPA: alpha/beta hydrolase [Gaiella sp.]|jgi:dipeptidyl aminopeptidase/acylaminoacyl peptidase|nr:alpha/beta hydrolase [Gaiella sp.]
MSAASQRTLDDARAWLLERLERGAHPLDRLDRDAAREAIESLESLDPEPWATSWGAVADRFAAEAAGARDAASRREALLEAYRFSFMGRFPVPNHPAKERQYARARALFLEATALDDPPLQRVSVPFEGREVCFYVARPAGVQRPPVVMIWGGIDTWKEEMYDRLGGLFRSKGVALLLVDMPGVGESPVLAGTDAERQWTPVFDWLATQDDLDSGCCAAVGASFGGYWAMKLAYTHRDHLRCAVNWGGGVHITFTPEWQEKSRNASSYLMDLMPARARIFGGDTFEDYVARCPELSLLDQGLLGEPSATILLVNGRDDTQNSIDDIYLSLDHGDPKAARVFDGGHMGEGPVGPTIAAWVMDNLGREPS